MANKDKKKGSAIGRWIKRIFKIVGVLLLLLIIAAIAIPYFFKDQILEKVKEEINNRVNATVDFADVNLSLLWTFPNFTFSMDSFSVTGHDEFEGLKLADIEQFKVSIDLWSVFFGEKYSINGVTLDKPKMYVKVLNNGKANYDIVIEENKNERVEDKKEEIESGETQFDIRLKYYAINNGDIIYDDGPGNMFVEVKNLVHTGAGDFSSDNYNLYTETDIDELTVKMDRIAYLNKTKIDITFNLKVDAANSVYTLLDNSFKLNSLEVNAEGEVQQLDEEKMKLDLKFNAPSTKFASVLSMVPAAFTKDFANVKSTGTFAFDAKINGTYSPSAMPAFGLNLSVDDASFQYPDLPLGVKDISTKVKINSPSSDLDGMIVDVSKFHIKVGDNPFDARLLLKTPMSDPDIDTKVVGKIDLAQLSDAFPLEGEGTSLTGLIESDLEAKTRLSYIETEQYDKVNMKGLLAISGIKYASKDLPLISLKTMKMDFTPNYVNLENLDLKIGKSDIKATGTLDNILTYFSRDKIMRGNLIVRSNLLDVNEITGEETADSPDEKRATDMVDTTAVAAEEAVFDRFNFAIDVEFNKILVDVYEITGLKTKGGFAPSLAELETFEMKIGEVDIQAEGQLEGVFGYVFDGDLLTGRMALNSNYMNLNQFMTESGEAVEPEPSTKPSDPSEEAMEAIEIPANIDFYFISKFQKLIYDKYKLNNAVAELHVKDQVVNILKLGADIFGGHVELNGAYNAQNIEEPKFKLAYDVKNLGFQAIAKTVGLVDQFLPIFKSLDGNLSSEFQMDGILGKDMSLDYNKVSADGLLQTFDATLKDLPALKKLSKLLRMDLEEVNLKNTTNFFTIEDGRIAFEPFVNNSKGIEMQLGGSHGLDNTMEYKLQMRVPRKLLEKNPIGQAANAAASNGLKALSGQAQKLGINLQDGEFINIAVDITGMVTDPKYKVKLLGAEGKGGKTLGDQATAALKEQMEKLKEEAKAKAQAKIDSAKAAAQSKLDGEKEMLRKEAEERAARAKAEAEARAKEALANSKIGDKLKDSLGTKVGDKIGDKIGDNLGDKNPFKKDDKKKDGKKKWPWQN